MTSEIPNDDPLLKFIAFTKAENWQFDSYQIADILWLWQQQQAFDESSENQEKHKPSQTPDDQNTGDKDQLTASTLSQEEQFTPPDGFPITFRSKGNKRETSIASNLEKLPISIPDTVFLRDTLKLGRAARPLIQKIDSPNQQELDIKRTVANTADYSIGNERNNNYSLTIIPAYKPKKVRSLDVILLIEESASMVFWKQMSIEIRDCLEQLGAFRDVKLYRIKAEKNIKSNRKTKQSELSNKQNKSSDFEIKIQTFENNFQAISAQDLIDPRGERLILFFSDCTSTAWYNGAYNQVLKEWGTYQLVTLLSPFPEKLWNRTALNQGWRVKLQNEYPRCPTEHWKFKAIPELLEIELEIKYQQENKKQTIDLNQYIFQQIKSTYFTLPILSLTPDSLSAWSQVVSGNSKATVAGRLLEISPSKVSIPTDKKEPSQEQDSETLIKRFANTASPFAWELMKKLSAVPINLPIIRLIQQQLLPHSTFVDAVEVILSGLLTPNQKLNFRLNPNSLEFEFREAIRDILLKSYLRERRSIEVISVLSDYVAKKLGLSTRNFEAELLTNPTKWKGTEHESLVRAFAILTVNTFSKLGEHYQQKTIELEYINQQLQPKNPPINPRFPKDSDWLTFLQGIAREIKLTNIETQTLTTIFPNPQQSCSIIDVANSLSCTDSAISSRLTRIYQKFEAVKTDLFPSNHNKLTTLHQYLNEQYQNGSIRKIPELESFETQVKIATIVVLDPLYHQLDELLKNQQFKEADDETYRLILETVGKQNLSEEDIPSISSDVLLTINLLWEHYSQGKFGFRKQVEICQNLGGIKDKNDRTFWYHFRNKVEWPIPKIINPLEQVPEGHFPYELSKGYLESAVMSRFMACELEHSNPNLNTETEETLQQWTFQTPTVNRRGETIKTTTYTASYFIEPLTDNVILEMVAIPGGTFTMGSPESESQYDDERPQHNVTLSPFFMGKYPITQAQWKAIASQTDLQVNIHLDEDPSNFKGDNRPVEQVNWYEAVEFCQRLSKLTGRDYQLPSEAQWEYACRAMTEPLDLEKGETYPPFYFGLTLTSDIANYSANKTFADEPRGKYRQQTTSVGQFFPNAFGLYDMHGNVWEWCEDRYHSSYYKGAPVDGSAWTDKKVGKIKILRGGSWFYNPLDCRSANRNSNIYDTRNKEFGFRVVCVFEETG